MMPARVWGTFTLALVLALSVPALAADGGQGNDFLRGTSRADVLRGGPGRDWIFGNDGDDEIYAGSGKDRINAGRGWDVCHVGRGDWFKGCEIAIAPAKVIYPAEGERLERERLG